MKCPRCGAETDKSKAYCQSCGCELRPRDNSNDDTLRLPDLSDVPLGQQPQRRRTGAPEKRRSGGAKIFIAVCTVIIAAALAVCLAVMVARRSASPAPAEIVDLPEEDYYTDEPDFGAFDHIEEEPEEEPADLPEEEPEEAPEEEGAKEEPKENDIVAEDVTPAREPVEEPAEAHDEEEPSESTSFSTSE